MKKNVGISDKCLEFFQYPTFSMIFSPYVHVNCSGGYRAPFGGGGENPNFFKAW